MSIAQFVLCALALGATSTPSTAEARLANDDRSPVGIHQDASVERPRVLHGPFALPAAMPEVAVRRFLAERAVEFNLDQDGLGLKLEQVRQGLAGRYYRFSQTLDGLPVFDGTVVVLLSDDSSSGVTLAALNLAQAQVRRPVQLAAQVDSAAALSATVAALGLAPDSIVAPEVLLGVDASTQTLAYRVRFGTTSAPGAWEALVAAGDGSVRRLRDRIVHVDGTGMVFDPNPVASTGNTGLIDDNDADSAALTTARFAVTLPRLDGSGALRGSFVDARPTNIAQRAFSPALTFDFTRNDNRFEEAMAYFHIDRAQARLQALGFTDVNNRRQVAITNDGNQDNSFYSPADLAIHYGAGGIDDAEDADILLHEYGHSIQDNQVPGFGGGDEGAMGEGFGDYYAASMNAVLSNEISDPNCLAEWDATAYSTGVPPCLRRLDGTKHYPEFANGEVHDDGEMWSAALTASRAVLGADVMDRLVLEAHFLLGTSETFQNAVNAILSTDQSLSGGAHLATLRKHFVEQGLSRELSTPAPGSSVTASDMVSIDNPRNGGVYDNLLDDSQIVSHPGAAAIRLHFSQIATETDPSCFAGACDNIYLYDADGRLYQILNGTLGPTDSVSIPGSSVRIRLVSDASIGAFGYHIDRVDVIAPPDALFSNGFED